MLVTLFTDASWCQDTGAAAWGAWCKSNRAGANGGGPIEEPCLSSNHAELFALRYGLRLAARNGILKPKDHVLWRTDCVHAMNVVNKAGRSTTDQLELQFLKELFEALGKWENSIQSTHIKGHQEVYHPTQWVQKRCHMIAIQYMRRERRKRYKEKENA